MSKGPEKYIGGLKPPNLIRLLCKRIEGGGLDALTDAERQVFAINWVLLETNIGGLHQFFFNDAGKYAADVITGLERIGATETLTIFRRAVALFPDGNVPRDQMARRELLASLPPEIQWEFMSELTAQFFRTSEDVPKLVNEFIETNNSRRCG